METCSSKNLVILGSNSDLGSAIIEYAAKHGGHKILAISRSTYSNEHGNLGNVEHLGGIDLTNEADLHLLCQWVGERFDAPFTIVHSVGNSWTHKPLVATAFSEVVEMVMSQVVTLLGVARFLTPIMIRNGGGRLVAFSCNSVIYNYPDMSPFTASKAAIESFVKSYANEHSMFGIIATALALPTIRTPKVLKEKTTGDHENYITPNELAECILDHLIAQPSYINGNVVKLFKHSDTFYHRSYYHRNPRQADSG